MTATDRFKRLLADALERVCVLEAELEEARARIAAQDEALTVLGADAARNSEPPNTRIAGSRDG